MRDIHNKRSIVTGAASGIGRAIAIELAKSSCHTCLLDVDEEGLSQTVREVKQLGVEAFGVICNVGDVAEIHRAFDEILARWPEIDILVNNAGTTFYGRSAEMVSQDWQRILAVNLHGPLEICQRMLPVLLSRPESHIVNVCSLLGLCAFPKFAAYSASKFGLVGYSESLRAEYLGSQLGVTAICPGFVRTPFIESVPGARGSNRKRSTPRWLSTSSEVVARKSVKAIRRNKAMVVVTPLAQLAWRLKRLFPNLFELARPFRSGRIPVPAGAIDRQGSVAKQKAA